MLKPGFGVLLPVSSLGGFGKSAYQFVDFLSKWHQNYWQVLPLCPRDWHGSPYNSPASMEIDSEYGSKAQWVALKKYANEKGIKIIGDLPFFVALNSPEYRANKELFLSDQFSGVPPDAFNRRYGQYWGQPQYNWEKLAQMGYKFQLDRFRYVLELFDVVRLDHFRGYEAVWSIPKKYKSGRKGKWVKVPGSELFKTATQTFGKLPFIAEDLGFITEEVNQLRKEFGFYGTRVAHWAKTVENDVVYYTSTHDTPTLVGKMGKRKAQKVISWVRNSQAGIKIILMGDLLGLDNRARINRPGRVRDNWRWKLDPNLLEDINKAFPNNQLTSWLS